MAMNVASSSGSGGRRGRRKPVVAEINVTPMVDVMLVLLIIFMVSAPMLTVGVPLDLAQRLGDPLCLPNLTTRIDVGPLQRTHFAGPQACLIA